MCGIAGIAAPRGEVDPDLLRAMARALEHRGPDDEGLWAAGGTGLAMRRLAVIDVTGGRQPLFSEDRRVVVVCNGEIYNHRALRRELEARGHRFATGSDAEVVVHLYEDAGYRCVERLRGMFAFAVWDACRGELLLARDRIGKKPLYWTHHGGTLRFASEPRAILQDPAVPRDVDPFAIDAFLVRGYVPHDRCAFAALHKLPPACTLRWRPRAGGAPRIERWWHLAHEPCEALGFDEAQEVVRTAILDAVAARLEADVPLGAHLSGGLDSSVVVAAMARTSPGRVRTFSVGFDDEIDESHHARAVARHVGTEHTELRLEPVHAGLLPRLAWHYGEPFADAAALPTFLLAETTRRAVTVALNGDGGDEAFGGYRRYRWMAASRVPGALPPGVWRGLASALRRPWRGSDGGAPPARAARLADRLALPPPRRYADLDTLVRVEDRARLYGPALAEPLRTGEPLGPIEAAWSRHPELGWVDRATATDVETYLPDDLLAKVDIASMAHGLEVRSPLLDHHLLELCARLPPGAKRRPGRPKALLRAIARDWLPPEIVDRRKQGFGMPVAGWLRHELRGLAEDVLLDPVASARGFHRPGEVRRLLAEHAEGRDHWRSLWGLLTLELWFRTCVDAPVATPERLPVLA
jgi:asparagine synthase (glutamine-hydrolysing)